MYKNLVLESIDSELDIEVIDREDRDDATFVDPEALTQEGETLLDNYDAAVETHDNINQIVETIEGSPDGVEPAVGNALEIVIEHMVMRVGVQRKQVTFEDYSTLRTKRQQTTLAVEGWKETAVAIWKKIVEFIRRIINWFKRANVSTAMRERSMDKRRNDTLDKIKKVKSGEIVPPSAASTPVVETFTHPSIQRMLRVGSVVPNPSDLVRMHAKHNTVMEMDYKTFGARMEEFNKSLDLAYSAVDKDDKEFQKHYNDALKIASTLPAGMHKSADQNRFGPLSRNCVVYEEPLVFASKAVFITASNDDKLLEPEDVHFGIMSSTKAYPADGEQVLQKLELQIATSLVEAEEKHSKVRRGQASRRMNAISALDRIADNAERISRDRNADKRTQARGRALLKLTSVGNRMMATFDFSLNKYDCDVQEAILMYAQYLKI